MYVQFNNTEKINISIFSIAWLPNDKKCGANLTWESAIEWSLSLKTHLGFKCSCSIHGFRENTLFYTSSIVLCLGFIIQSNPGWRIESYGIIPINGATLIKANVSLKSVWRTSTLCIPLTKYASFRHWYNESRMNHSFLTIWQKVVQKIFPIIPYSEHV